MNLKNNSESEPGKLSSPPACAKAAPQQGRGMGMALPPAAPSPRSKHLPVSTRRRRGKAGGWAFGFFVFTLFFTFVPRDVVYFSGFGFSFSNKIYTRMLKIDLCPGREIKVHIVHFPSWDGAHSLRYACVKSQVQCKC